MRTWRFSYRRYRLPFRAAVRTAHGQWAERDGVIVRLEDDRGAIRHAEAATMPAFGTETAEEAEAACRALGATVDDARVQAVPSRLPCLRHALAAASTPPVPVPDSSSLPLAALLPAGRGAAAAAGPLAEAGFRVFKWKVGVEDVDRERGILDEVCSVLPAGSKLRLDANGAWDRRQAERWLECCAGRPVEWVEQPSFDDDLLLGLARDYPTPLALDESLVGEGDVDRWLGLGWPGVFVVKPSLFGDPAAVLSRLAAARAAVGFSSALETAIGARDALRTAFSWPGEKRALGFGVWPLFADARFDGPPAAPFLRWSDVDRINPEALWNALS